MLFYDLGKFSRRWLGAPVSEVQTWGRTALKMGVAATAALIMAEVLNLGYPFYAVIAPIIVMGTTQGGTLEAGMSRIKGTVIGTLMGGLFASLLGSQAASLAIAVTLSIFLSQVWGLGEAYRVAGYVAAIALIDHGHEPWTYAGGRFLETFLGIAVAIAVDDLLWPPRAATKLQQTLAQLLLDLADLYQLIVDSYGTGEYHQKAIGDRKAQLILALRQVEKLWREAKREPRGKLLVDETWEFLSRRIWEHLLTMDYVASEGRGDRFWEGMQPQLSDLATATRDGFLQLAEAIASRNSRPQLPDLAPLLRAATEKLDELQDATHAPYSTAELRRFLSFFYSMEETAKKLKQMERGL